MQGELRRVQQDIVTSRRERKTKLEQRLAWARQQLQAEEDQALQQHLAEEVLQDPRGYHPQELVLHINEPQGANTYVHTGANAQAPPLLPGGQELVHERPGDVTMQGGSRRRGDQWSDHGLPARSSATRLLSPARHEAQGFRRCYSSPNGSEASRVREHARSASQRRAENDLLERSRGLRLSRVM